MKDEITHLYCNVREENSVDEESHLSLRQPPLISPILDQRPLRHSKSVVPETLPRSALD